MSSDRIDVDYYVVFIRIYLLFGGQTDGLDRYGQNVSVSLTGQLS